MLGDDAGAEEAGAEEEVGKEVGAGFYLRGYQFMTSCAVAEFFKYVSLHGKSASVLADPEVCSRLQRNFS